MVYKSAWRIRGITSGERTKKFVVHVIENKARKLDCSKVAEALECLSLCFLCVLVLSGAVHYDWSEKYKVSISLNRAEW